jgi:hypothetical protein
MKKNPYFKFLERGKTFREKVMRAIEFDAWEETNPYFPPHFWPNE